MQERQWWSLPQHSRVFGSKIVQLQHQAGLLKLTAKVVDQFKDPLRPHDEPNLTESMRVVCQQEETTQYLLKVSLCLYWQAAAGLLRPVLSLCLACG